MNIKLSPEREAAIRERGDYYSYDPEDGFYEHSTAKAAKSSAEEALDCYRDNAGDGWGEAVGEVQWGRLITLGHAALAKGAADQARARDALRARDGRR
jgi:hypothetical protein